MKQVGKFPYSLAYYNETPISGFYWIHNGRGNRKHRWFEFQEFVRKSTLLEKEHIEEKKSV